MATGSKGGSSAVSSGQSSSDIDASSVVVSGGGAFDSNVSFTSGPILGPPSGPDTPPPPPFVFTPISGTISASGPIVVPSAPDTHVTGFPFSSFHFSGSGTFIARTPTSVGAQYVSSGAVAIDTVVTSGAPQIVASGGVAIGTVISSGGYEIVSSGAVAIGTVISSGAIEVVSSGAVASYTEVLSGGTLDILPGGSASDTISSGGYIVSGGTVIIGPLFLAPGFSSQNYLILDSSGIITATAVLDPNFKPDEPSGRDPIDPRTLPPPWLGDPLQAVLSGPGGPASSSTDPAPTSLPSSAAVLSPILHPSGAPDPTNPSGPDIATPPSPLDLLNGHLVQITQAAAFNFTASGIAGATLTGDSVVSSGATLTQPGSAHSH